MDSELIVVVIQETASRGRCSIVNFILVNHTHDVPFS